MSYLVFGNENAESDDLLKDCYITRSDTITKKPILVGRWGTGKTAILLHQGRNLEQTLAAFDSQPRKLWYVSESSLNLAELRSLQKESGEIRHVFEKTLEGLWRAEILRILCLQLSYLHKSFGSPRGDHWKDINRVAKTPRFVSSIWSAIPDAVAVLRGTQAGTEGLGELRKGLAELSQENTLHRIQQCLTDVKGHNIKPLIAVEPIDSPASELEDEGGLAQNLITALLNVFRSTFEPSQYQLIDVRLSIPWHRYNVDTLEYPQKLAQYIGRVAWSRDQLREFINRRIEWEFARVNRPFIQKGGIDAWNTLIESRVSNIHCESRMLEDSFEYILRHSHHRARDIQHITRLAVETQLVESQPGTTIEDILSSKKTHGVWQVNLRTAVKKYCRISQSLRVTEARRRYPQVKDIVEQLYGIPVPFTISDLKKRAERVSLPGTPSIYDIIHQLWEAGILGVEIIPRGDAEFEFLSSRLNSSGYRSYVSADGRKKFRRWFLFEYNWDEQIQGLINGLEAHEGIKVNYILHPHAFEHLTPKTQRDCPIGA